MPVIRRLQYQVARTPSRVDRWRAWVSILSPGGKGMRRFGLQGFALAALVLAACSGDAISPSDSRTPPSVGIPKPQPTDAPQSCTATDITSHLSGLMGGLVPNDNSTLGKFQYVQTLLGYNNPDST